MPKNVSVLIVDKSIASHGVLANAALVIGMTAGRELPADAFGHETIDGAGAAHTYLTNIGHLVRRAGQGKLRSLRDELAARDDVLVIDYPEDAAPADYDLFASNLASHCGAEIRYRAVYFYGPDEVVTPRTRSLSRLP